MAEPNAANLAKNPAYRSATGKPCICRVFLLIARPPYITDASRTSRRGPRLRKRHDRDPFVHAESVRRLSQIAAYLTVACCQCVLRSLNRGTWRP